MQVPAPTMVTSDPDTVQTGSVMDANVTGSPAEDVAPIWNGGVPAATLLCGTKVMVCEPGVTVKLCVTAVAAL